jgi:FkbM family methyltransferase
VSLHDGLTDACSNYQHQDQKPVTGRGGKGALKMINQVRHFVKSRPVLYDIGIRAKRAIGWKTPSYDFFNRLSHVHNGCVNFIQIGANDGIRNDPIREFIIRDRWTGILVEPLPAVFAQLKDNYRRVKGTLLVFVNAAISTSNSENISFWTFDDRFLAPLPFEKRMWYLRKSSTSKDQLKKAVRGNYAFDQIVKEIKVPSMTLSHLVQKYWVRGQINLLVIDAEGHESAILTSMDFEVLNPDAIFFESQHLNRDKNKVFDFLSKNEYKMSEAHGDAIACRHGLTWHNNERAAARPEL